MPKPLHATVYFNLVGKVISLTFLWLMSLNKAVIIGGGRHVHLQALSLIRQTRMRKASLCSAAGVLSM